MSREWYIRTDKRHIQDTFGDIDVKPLTFKEKWQIHRKKYILWIVEAAVLIALFCLAIPYLFFRNTADYTVTLVTATYLTDEAEEKLVAALEAVGKDRNDDGKVEVELRALAVNAEQKEDGRNVALEKLLLSFRTEEYTLFAMEPDMYERYVKAYTAENSTLFEPLTTDGDMFRIQPKTADFPKLLWGVRAIPNANEKALEKAQAHRALLDAYIAAQ